MKEDESVLVGSKRILKSR